MIGNDYAAEVVSLQNSLNIHVTFVNERFFTKSRLQEFYFWQTNP